MELFVLLHHSSSITTTSQYNLFYIEQIERGNKTPLFLFVGGNNMSTTIKEKKVENKTENKLEQKSDKGTLKHTKARLFYGTGTSNVNYLVKSKERKVVTQVINGVQTDSEVYTDSVFRVNLHDATGATPELLKQLDPTGQRIIYDRDDKRLNIKGAPYHYPINLGHINVVGSSFEKVYDLTPELALNDFLFNVGIPTKDKQVRRIIVGFETSGQPITKDFFITQCGAVVFEEVEIGTPGSYDLNQYEQKVFRNNSGFIRIPEQDEQRQRDRVSWQ